MSRWVLRPPVESWGELFLGSMENKKTYSELLRSPLWQKKRLRILERDDFTCQHCGCKERELQVHHRIYHKGAKPWEYDDSELITLCSRCHEIETEENNFLYSTFCDLKTMFGQVGLSKTAMNACFQRIATFLAHFISEFSEDGYDGYESDSVENGIKELIYDAVCGTQLFSDAKALEKMGFDMTDYFLNVKTPNLNE